MEAFMNSLITFVTVSASVFVGMVLRDVMWDHVDRRH